MPSKTVVVIATAFNCLPGHVTVEGKGSATTLAAAIHRAVTRVIKDPRLKRRRLARFKLDVVITRDEGGGHEATEPIPEVSNNQA